MTVEEVITALTQFPHDANVYVQDPDGTVQIAQLVENMEHINLPPGIRIPPDVLIRSRDA